MKSLTKLFIGLIAGFILGVGVYQAAAYVSESLGALDGTAGSPSFYFHNDNDTGMYRSAANEIAFSTGGVNRLTISNTAVTFGQTVVLGNPDGTAAAPGITFQADTDTGFYRVGANRLGVTTGGVAVLEWDATGDMLWATDNADDIGATGASRPRDLFLGRDAAIGGTLAVTGATTLTGALTVTGAATLNGNSTIGSDAVDTTTVNAVIASNLTFAEDTARTISPAAQATANTAGDALTIRAGIGNGTAAGGAMNVTGGNGGTGAGGNGGAVAIAGGAAGAASAGNGGNVTLNGGALDGAGVNGNVVIAGIRGALQVGATSPMSMTNIRIFTVTDADVSGAVADGACAFGTALTVTGVNATDNLIVTRTSTDLVAEFATINPQPGANTVTFNVCNDNAAGGGDDPGAVADFRIIAIAGS